MLLKIDVDSRLFDVPRIFFTLKGNFNSQRVLKSLEGRVQDGSQFRIFDDARSVSEYFEGGVSRRSAVVLFDQGLGRHRSMRMICSSRHDQQNSFPNWAAGVLWGVEVANADGITDNRIDSNARQLACDFSRRFRDQLAADLFPWGRPRKGERPPKCVTMPADMSALLFALNSGPDLVGAIAHADFANDLPTGSKISWVRVVPRSAGIDGAVLSGITQALQNFQGACQKLLQAHPETRSVVLAGVDLDASDPRLPDLYLDPPSDRFMIDRPDLHYTDQDGLFASEIDEMPGGFADLVHLDNAYCINQGLWKKCFDGLTSAGLLLFVVSNDWSKPYVSTMAWLVEHLIKLGYNAAFVTTDDLSAVSVRHDGVFWAGQRVGTIWRQFPIFETRGKLVDLVVAARHGQVRMVPEFAHFGNKTWFSLFRRYQDFFAAQLDAETYNLLKEVLPDSHLVLDRNCFPANVGGMMIAELDALIRLDSAVRDRLVLKVCGANNKSARMYGVLMGHGLSNDIWQGWINDRLAEGQPFIIQERHETGVAHVPVRNTKTGEAELFGCRMIIRPWTFDGQLISASAAAVPSNTLRVHGRVDMAVLPFKLE